MIRIPKWAAPAAIAALCALAPAAATADWRTAQVQDVHFASIETGEMALFLACRRGVFSVNLVVPQALPPFKDLDGPVASFRFKADGAPQRFRTVVNASTEGPHTIYRLVLTSDRAGVLVQALRRRNAVTVTLTGGASADQARAVQAALSLAGSNRALRKVRDRCV